jgi:hypothetical protein
LVETYQGLYDGVFSGIGQEIKNLSLVQLSRLIVLLGVLHEKKEVSKYLPLFERRFFDLRSELVDNTMLVEFIVHFGQQNYQSDEFWEFATQLLVKQLPNIRGEVAYSDVMRGYAAAHRGSNPLWERIIQGVFNVFDQPSFELLLCTYRCILQVGFSSTDPQFEFLTFKALIDLLPQNELGLTSLGYEDIAYIANYQKDLQFTELAYLEGLIAKGWDSCFDDSKHHIAQMYQRNGRTSDILDIKFTLLTPNN